MKRHVPSSFAINPNEIADFKYKPEQSLFKRTITLAILAVILVPLWIPFDYILDRQHFKIFLALRIALVIGVIITFLFSLKLKHSEYHHQTIALIIYLLLIVTILPMVIITDAKFPYLLGLSTCFFGISILIVWPLRYMAIPLVTTMVLFSVFSWNQIDIKQFISILFPLLTIGVLSLVASWFTYENHQNSEALLAGLNQLSFTDQLTELYNRRYLVLRLDDEIHRAKRDNSTIAVMRIDVDFFKNYNDHYGHQHGDVCLKQIGACLYNSITRNSDFVARYGGEEFIIVLPITDENGVKKVVERVITSVRELNIPHAASPITENVTVSIGVACCDIKSDTTPDMVVSIADDALYQAKKNGRNQFSITGMAGT